MKIRKLFLTAFGPFTQAALDFSGAANLHLVYGANEAGKSSALRAMTDLRYGIPPRSKDDFVHGFKDMQLAGCFEDAAGRELGLARRKGNKDTLTSADPSSGQPQAGPALSAEVLLALTGGVAREQFDTMYGLDSVHLRKGGQMLIQGEGELGAALFEASTGAAGIKQMLQTLQQDAKKYFVPKGQLPLLNEAARQLEEARQRYRQAVTKPDHWKALKRVHDDVQGQLAQARQELAGQRRRLGELTELRAVEPLLRELEMAEIQWHAIQGHVALPADARDCRLAALQHQALSQNALLEADEAIAQCGHSLQALQIEPLLLSHAPAIDRLEADMSLVRRERDGRLKLQAAVDNEGRQLMLRAQQMLPGGQGLESLEDFFRRAPSAADQAAVLRALEAFEALNIEWQQVQARLAADTGKLAQLQHAQVREPAPDLRQALVLALEQARSLGDAQQRLLGLQAGLQAEQRKLDATLRDMGLQSPGQLTLTGWLALAEIDDWERERSELLKQVALDENSSAQLQTDLAVQQLRSKRLAATGEVVTADTLRLARELRQAHWHALRAVLHSTGAAAGQALGGELSGSPLALRFEQSQAEADRQADLLREGAQRAAEVTECGHRMAEMTQSLAALQTRQAGHAEALATLDSRWQQTLLQLGIPAGTAAGVREWLAVRQTALDRHERLVQTQVSHGLLVQQMATACQGLSAALRALGHALPESPPSLDALLTLGTAADRELMSVRAAMQRWQADLSSLGQSVQADQARHDELTGMIQDARLALEHGCSHLSLDKDAQAPAIKARLAELQRWVNDYQLHAGQRQQLQQLQASEAAAAQSALALGRLLQEPAWEHSDAWLDELARRLACSREASAAKAVLQGRQAEAAARRQRAQSALEAAQQTLLGLVDQAGVEHAGELPEAEARSELQHTQRLRLQGLKEQLARTSRKDRASLQAELASRDSVAIEQEKQACAATILALEADEKAAIDAEQTAAQAWAQIDTSDEAAQAREEMEAAIARYRAGVRPWARLKLGEALRRHREKAQGPVVALAGEYFALMTAGRFVRLVVDADSDTPLLLAQPAQGKAMEIAALSEGTADQLYLALRLAALQVQRKPDRLMPLVLDDVFMTADDERATHMFRALAKFAAASQVLVFTHHHHLLALASSAVGEGELRVHRLEAGLARNQ